MSDYIEMCPWDTTPSNVEAMLIACRSQALWEAQHNRPAPAAWGIVPTRLFMGALCARLLQLEMRLEQVNNERP